jgi:hypothetical protein
MCALAIALVIRDAGIDFGFIGVVVGGYLTAAAAVGPLLGRMVDRVGPCWVLVGSAGCGAAALTVLAAAPGHKAIALTAALVAGIGTPPLEPTLRALWPRLVPPNLLQHAYGVDASSQTLIFVVGPLLVSAATWIWSSAVAVLLATGLMVTGVLLVVGSPVIRSQPGLGWSGPRPDQLVGRTFVILVVALAGAGGSVGALNVYAVDYALECRVVGGAGAIPATAALAGMLCGLAVGALRWRLGRLRVLAGCVAAGAVVLVAVPVCSPAVFLGAAAAGMFLPPLLGSAFGLIYRTVPPGRSAEALAWLTTLFIAGSAVATVLSGAAVEMYGPPGAAVVGAAMAAAGAILSLALRGADA